MLAFIFSEFSLQTSHEMFSRAATHFKSFFNGGSNIQLVQPVPSVSDLTTCEITEPLSFDTDEYGNEGVRRRIRNLIRNHDTYWEAYLNFHHSIGISPFRLHKNGQRDSPLYCKVMSLNV